MYGLRAVGMINPGELFLIGLAIVILLFIFFGGLFLWKISGKQYKIHQLFTSTFRAFFAWCLPPWGRALKIFIAVALISAGLLMIMISPRTETYTVVTGYRYILKETPSWQFVPDYWCKLVTTPSGQFTEQCGFAQRPVTVYRYNLMGFKIESMYAMWWLDPGMFLIGFTLIIIGLILVAYFLSKETNKAYGVEK